MPQWYREARSAPASMCSLCLNHAETSFHLFFDLPYARKLWYWFANTINKAFKFTQIDDIWKICDLHWSPQCKVMIKSDMINLINTIWFVRNQSRYHDMVIPWKSVISIIIANASMSGNHTALLSYNSVTDFSILRSYRVKINYPKAPDIKEIFWKPPMINWTKCNIDGA